MVTSIAALLRARTAAAGHRPFLTAIPETHDEREELSYATFANWVGKTANLLSEEFGVGPGDRVALSLRTSWPAAVVAAACWTRRAVVVVGGGTSQVRLAVRGEGAGVPWPAGAGRLVVGDGMAGRLLGPAPAGAVPYGEEVLAHADEPEDTGPALDAEALVTPAPASRTQGELLAAAGSVELAPGGRLLTTLALDGVDGLALGLLGPLLAQGAVVLVAGRPDAPTLLRLARQERAATLLTDPEGVAALAGAEDLSGLTRVLCPGGAPPAAAARLAEAGVEVD